MSKSYESDKTDMRLTRRGRAVITLSTGLLATLSAIGVGLEIHDESTVDSDAVEIYAVPNPNPTDGTMAAIDKAVANGSIDAEVARLVDETDAGYKASATLREGGVEPRSVSGQDLFTIHIESDGDIEKGEYLGPEEFDYVLPGLTVEEAMAKIATLQPDN